MAIIHRATLTPTKLELIAPWLDAQPWAGAGEVELIGSYRFDDPDGEVGVEAMLIRRGDTVLHVPLTYRGDPLEGAEAHLIGTTQHSVLGKRWVYHAAGDPVAQGCFERALRGEQRQAVMEVYDGATLVAVQDQTVHLVLETEPIQGPGVRLAQVVGELEGRHRLIANWEGGSGAVAAGESAGYDHTSSPIGLRVDVANVGEALDVVDGTGTGA